MNIRIIVRTIIIWDRKILLMKKRDADFWHFPGGKLEKGESLEDAAIREGLEETGLNFTVDEIYWCQNYVVNNNNYIELFFMANIVGISDEGLSCIDNSNDVDDDIERVSWIDIDDLSGYSIKPIDLLAYLRQDNKL